MRTSSSTTYTASLLALLAVASAARAFYYTVGELRFDAETLDYYFQFVDPHLLRTDLVQSVLHLHSQPPLFNLFLGVVLKVFASHYALAFNAFYIGAGVILVLSMFHLQLRLGVDPRLAAVVTGLFAISPVTMLYENWLYPTYLIAAMLTLATLLLHRYLTHQRLWDAAGFFAILGVVVLTRGLFHIVWFLLPVLALLVAMPTVRRRTFMAIVMPLAVVVGASVLHYVHFDSLSNGNIYQELNLAQMTTLRLSPETRERLIRSGKISPINRMSVYDATPADYARYVPPPAPTGIAVLDQQVKSTGVSNWHSAAFIRIADQYGRDGRFVLREYPGVYASAVRKNVQHFFLPADQSDPFRTASRGGARGTPVSDRMRSFVRVWDFVFSGQLRYENLAFFNIIAFFAIVTFSIAFFSRWFFRHRQSKTRDDPSSKADAMTVLFMIYNFLYIGVITIALSSNDQSRYRFKAAPMVCVLLAMLVNEAWQRRRNGQARDAAVR